MTNREAINAMSNSEMSEWINTMISADDMSACDVCPAEIECRRRRMAAKEEGREYGTLCFCTDIISDWLEKEEERDI